MRNCKVCGNLPSKVAVCPGHYRGLLEGPCAYEVPRSVGRQSSEESSQFHEELANWTSAMTEVEEVFTQLLENFDSCPPHSLQQARAVSELWGFYDSNAHELEASAAELGSVSRTRLSTAIGQTAMQRVSTSPSALTFPPQMASPEHANRTCQLSGKQQVHHRRSRSFS